MNVELKKCKALLIAFSGKKYLLDCQHIVNIEFFDDEIEINYNGLYLHFNKFMFECFGAQNQFLSDSYDDCLIFLKLINDNLSIFKCKKVEEIL